MSSRQLKKLHKQQELLKLQQLADNEDASSEEEVAPPKPRPSAFAGFAALGGDDDNDGSTKEEEQEEEGGESNWEPWMDMTEAEFEQQVALYQSLQRQQIIREVNAVERATAIAASASKTASALSTSATHCALISGGKKG